MGFANDARSESLEIVRFHASVSPGFGAINPLLNPPSRGLQGLSRVD